MDGRCHKHLFETAKDACRQCGHEFCGECLVYSFGERKPPFCVPCGIAAAGIRRNAGLPPANTRRDLKQQQRDRRREAKAAAKSAVKTTRAETRERAKKPAPVATPAPADAPWDLPEAGEWPAPAPEPIAHATPEPAASEPLAYEWTPAPAEDLSHTQTVSSSVDTDVLVTRRPSFESAVDAASADQPYEAVGSRRVSFEWAIAEADQLKGRAVAG